MTTRRKRIIKKHTRRGTNTGKGVTREEKFHPVGAVYRGDYVSSGTTTDEYDITSNKSSGTNIKNNDGSSIMKEWHKQAIGLGIIAVFITVPLVIMKHGSKK
jgi:hypothetical protein